MAKEKTIFYCTECGAEFSRWSGQCTACSIWNSIKSAQQFSSSGSSSRGHAASSSTKSSQRGHEVTLVNLAAIPDHHHARFITTIDEWDRVMGGGILPGSFIILTGDPGVGKSTLLLHIADALTNITEVCYFSSEESLQQVKNRAMRIGLEHSTIHFSDSTHLDAIIERIIQDKPGLVIIDSLQSCSIESDAYAFPGTIAQLREAAFKLMRVAKEHHIALIVTGHITKDGTMAGPKILEHMVDAVFYLQADERFETRILRSVKNRFGTINEIGFFQMQEGGMQQVSNINAQLLQTTSHAPGAALICSFEGSRPLLAELQALCVESKLTNPQRVISGIDHKKVVLVAAILEKYLRIKLSAHDLFFKVSGGFLIREAGADLGIALALLSSYFQKPLPPRTLAIGELSLTGHISSITSLERHIAEAQKFGIENVIISAKAKISKDTSLGIKPMRNIYDLAGLFEE